MAGVEETGEEPRVGALAVLVPMMRELHAHRDEHRAEMTSVDRNLERDLTQWIRAGAAFLRGQDFDARSVPVDADERLVAAMPLPEPIPRWTGRRAVALSFDAAYGDDISQLCLEWYAARAGHARLDNRFAVRLRPGDPVPVSRERRHRVRGADRTTEGRATYEEASHRLPHVTLVPDLAAGTEVIVDFRLYDAWPHPGTASVGTCHPTRGWRDFDTKTFPVVPVDEQAIIERLRGQLDALSAAGCQVVLLPELVSTPTIRRALIDHWLTQGLRRPPILVPGSEHGFDADGSNVNITFVVSERDAADGSGFATVPEFAHRKFRPVTGGMHGVAWAREPLATQPVSVRVHVTPDLKAAVLICRDADDDVALALLKALEVDIVLVPALTPSFDQLVGVGRDVAQRYLTELYVANGVRVAHDGVSTAAASFHPRLLDPLQFLAAPSDEFGLGIFVPGRPPAWSRVGEP